MIKLKIDDKQYTIPTNYGELIYQDYAEMQDKQVLKQISIITGIDYELLGGLDIGQYFNIMDMVKFIGEPVQFEPIETDISIGGGEFGDLEYAKQQLQNEPNMYLAMIPIIKKYMEIDISKQPVSEVYGYVDFFLSSSRRSLPNLNG